MPEILFNYYCILVRINNVYYPIQVEFYNPFTCYLYDNELISVFKTFKKANNYKNKIIEWRDQKRLHKSFMFDYITITQIKEVKYFKKNENNKYISRT